MDMRKYSGAAFLKLGDVKVNGPLRVVIVDTRRANTAGPIWSSMTAPSSASTPPITGC
jgi:hypothetical protein